MDEEEKKRLAEAEAKKAKLKKQAELYSKTMTNLHKNEGNYGIKKTRKWYKPTSGSGWTGPGGIDLAHNTREDLVKMGFPAAMIKEAEDAGAFGKTDVPLNTKGGEFSKEQYKAIEKSIVETSVAEMEDIMEANPSLSTDSIALLSSMRHYGGDAYLTSGNKFQAYKEDGTTYYPIADAMAKEGGLTDESLNEAIATTFKNSTLPTKYTSNRGTLRRYLKQSDREIDIKKALEDKLAEEAALVYKEAAEEKEVKEVVPRERDNIPNVDKSEIVPLKPSMSPSIPTGKLNLNGIMDTSTIRGKDKRDIEEMIQYGGYQSDINSVPSKYGPGAYVEDIAPANKDKNVQGKAPESSRKFAYGGTLDNNEAAGDALTTINVGGTHEENPNGGVKVGQDAQGVPDTVEENETIKKIGGKKFVFSDQLYLTAQDIKDFFLPGYLKDAGAYGDASKQIEKRFEGRTDNHSNSTKEKMYMRLSKSQEQAKLRKEAKDAGISVEELLNQRAEQAAAEQQQAQQQAQAQAEQQGQPQGPQQGQPQEQPQAQFRYGGNTFNLGGIMGGVADMGMAAGEAANVDTSGVEQQRTVNVGGAMAKGALMGAAAGSVVPGIGTAIGAGVGAAAMGVSTAIGNKKIESSNLDKTIKAGVENTVVDREEAAQHRYGGEVNQYGLGEYFSKDNRMSRRGVRQGRRAERQYDREKRRGNEKPGEGEDEGFNWAGAAGMGAQLAPFVGNMIAAKNLDRPAPNHIRNVGRTYIPNFADERGQMNVVNESFAGTNEALANATNNNIGAYRAGIQGNAVNKFQASNQAYGQINAINRQEQANLNADFATASKEGVDNYNTEQDLNKQDMAAYDYAKGKYRAAAYEGLQDLGKTIFLSSQADDMTDYDILGSKKKQ